MMLMLMMMLLGMNGTEEQKDKAEFSPQQRLLYAEFVRSGSDTAITRSIRSLFTPHLALSDHHQIDSITFVVKYGADITT